MSDVQPASADGAAWQVRRNPLLEPPARRGFENVSRVRFWLAAFLVTITPGTLLIWAHLHTSGYTYNGDGSRDLGHLAKAIPSDLALAAAISLTVLGLGLLSVQLARKGRTLAAPRLLLFAGCVGAAAGLLASGPLALISQGGPSGLRLLATSAAVTMVVLLGSAVLCLEFILISATPFHATTAHSRSRRPLARLADRVVLFTAVVAAISATGWIALLCLYMLQHPCDCG